MKPPRTPESLDADMAACFKSLCDNQAQAMRSLQSIWKDIGIYGEAKVARLDSFRTHVSRLFQDMIDEEESNKLMIVQRIEEYMKDITKISKELSGEAAKLPGDGMDSAPLYQVEKCLKEKWDELQRLKDQRVELVEDLQRRHDDVRYRLGKKDMSPYSGGITELEIEALKFRVHLLEQERDRLQASYEETRTAIEKIYEDLEMTPTSLLMNETDSFILSPENMNALKKLHQTMEQKLSDSKDTATELRERLSNLWERLQITADHRESFLHAHRGYSQPTINALKQELKRCEALKKANIEKFVCLLRDEICSWWDRCYYSEKQRREFQPFYFTDFNEDVLELHELEVSKLKEFYENNRDIFQLAEERNELWSKMLELEDRANDPKRLFNNRGGQLLREERERNALAKTLPKIENELKERLLAYEQEHKAPFQIDGQNLLDIINQQNEERSGMKEFQKQQKKVTRSHLLEVESKLGTKALTPSFKRGRLTPHSPSMLGSAQKTLTVASQCRSAPPKSLTSTLKRKADVSPHTNVSKKSKGGRKSSEKKSSRSGSKSGPRYSIRRYGKGPSRTQEASTSKTRRNIMSHLPSDNFSITSGIGPYSEFQNQLELMSTEKACRSSVVPPNCLREANTPVSNPSSVSSKTKMRLTPGRITTATHLTLTPGTSLTVTPMKPPRRNGISATPTPTQVRRTSTRLNLKSPSAKSPAPGTHARLTTPRSRLPIVF